MFEQLSSSRIRGMEPREAFIALLSLLFHAAGVASLLAASWLSLTPIPLPILHPVLLTPVIFPRAGAPAPKLGNAPLAAKSEAAKPREARETEPLIQPSHGPESPAETQPASGSATRSDAAEVEGGPGSPEGLVGGSTEGFPGANCVGDGCDPEGPLGAGPGSPEGGEGAPPEIYFPGISQVTEPEIIAASKVLPRYPELARRSGVEGQVILQAVIGSEGQVGSVVVLKETPPRVGFGESAAEAVTRWRYRPGTLHGAPVAVRMTLTVVFTLSH